jgi:hypothetical protein
MNASAVPAVCKPMFGDWTGRQQGQGTLELMLLQQQQQQHMSQTVLGSSPQQNSGMLNMLAACQLPEMKLLSNTASLELEELVSSELNISSLLSMPAKRMAPQLQQQLAQGSFVPSPLVVSDGSSSGCNSSNGSPFLSAAYQQAQLQQQQQQQQQVMMLQQYSGNLTGDMAIAGALHSDFALAPRNSSFPVDGALVGALAMPRVHAGSSSSTAQQQQQFQVGHPSDPWPRLDPALRHMQEQLAAASLTADMLLAPAAAAAAGSSSRMPLLMQSGCSSVSNSDVLGSSPPGLGSPLCNVVDEEIMRLLKVGMSRNVCLFIWLASASRLHYCSGTIFIVSHTAVVLFCTDG